MTLPALMCGCLATSQHPRALEVQWWNIIAELISAWVCRNHILVLALSLPMLSLAMGALVKSHRLQTH